MIKLYDRIRQDLIATGVWDGAYPILVPSKLADLIR